MATKVNLKITATSTTGEAVSTTVQNVNPESTNQTLLTFAKKLNLLTDNSYVSCDKITTVNLDTAS